MDKQEFAIKWQAIEFASQALFSKLRDCVLSADCDVSTFAKAVRDFICEPELADSGEPSPAVIGMSTRVEIQIRRQVESVKRYLDPLNRTTVSQLVAQLADLFLGFDDLDSFKSYAEAWLMSPEWDLKYIQITLNSTGTPGTSYAANNPVEVWMSNVENKALLADFLAKGDVTEQAKLRQTMLDSCNYNEYYMEMLGALWLLTYFMGERRDDLWERVVAYADRQVGYPGGLCFWVACGSIYSSSLRRLSMSRTKGDVYVFASSPILKQGKIDTEEWKNTLEIAERQLTDWSGHGLGFLYLITQLCEFALVGKEIKANVYYASPQGRSNEPISETCLTELEAGLFPGADTAVLGPWHGIYIPQGTANRSSFVSRDVLDEHLRTWRKKFREEIIDRQSVQSGPP